MDNTQVNNTVSTSKQESILKAIQNLEQNDNEIEITVVRPNINLPFIILKKLMRIVVFAAIVFLFVILSGYINKTLSWVLCAVVILAVALLLLKGIVIEWVLIYQKFAPEKLRSSCRFQPTCSEYMILAIEKYGALKGLVKGIGRLFRCRYPNGGIDYP